VITSEGYLYEAQDVIYSEEQMNAMVMEEGCTVSGKITGFIKMIGTHM
jgi:hypothetical protein